MTALRCCGRLSIICERARYRLEETPNPTLIDDGLLQVAIGMLTSRDPTKRRMAYGDVTQFAKRGHQALLRDSCDIFAIVDGFNNKPEERKDILRFLKWMTKGEHEKSVDQRVLSVLRQQHKGADVIALVNKVWANVLANGDRELLAEFVRDGTLKDVFDDFDGRIGKVVRSSKAVAVVMSVLRVLPPLVINADVLGESSALVLRNISDRVWECLTFGYPVAVVEEAVHAFDLMTDISDIAVMKVLFSEQHWEKLFRACDPEHRYMAVDALSVMCHFVVLETEVVHRFIFPSFAMLDYELGSVPSDVILMVLSLADRLIGHRELVWDVLGSRMMNKLRAFVPRMGFQCKEAYCLVISSALAVNDVSLTVEYQEIFSEFVVLAAETICSVVELSRRCLLGTIAKLIELLKMRSIPSIEAALANEDLRTNLGTIFNDTEADENTRVRCSIIMSFIGTNTTF